MNDVWQQMLQPKVFYQGRLWDAPFTDHAMPADLTEYSCTWCEEPIEEDDNAVKMPHTVAHLECILCVTLGSIAHLEKRCSCYKGNAADDHENDYYPSFREKARATLLWLIANHNGRFKPDD